MLTRISSPLTGRSMPFGSALLTLIAVATTGYASYRYLATQQANGTIVATRPYCELVSCYVGKCSSRQQMACSDIPSTLQTNQHVRRFDQLRIEFAGRDGHARASWSEIGKLGRTKGRIGDKVEVHYIDRIAEEPEITAKPSLFLTILGISAFIFCLSVGARRHRSSWETQA